MVTLRSRAGRPRSLTATRTPSGRAIAAAPDLPAVALRQRAQKLGISQDAAQATLQQLCKVQDLDSAVARLTWEFRPDGTRVRRILISPAGEVSPVLSDAMVKAAEVYRMTYAAWQRTNAMPSRTPVSGLRALDSATHGRSTAAEPSLARQQHITALWAKARKAIASCKAPVLCQRCVDDVVLENTVAPSFLERPAAVAALRRALLALAEIFGVSEQIPTPRTPPLPLPIAQAALAARAEGLSYAAVHRRIVESFGHKAPSKTALFHYLKSTKSQAAGDTHGTLRSRLVRH